MKVTQPKRYRWSTIISIFAIGVGATFTFLGPAVLTLFYLLAGRR